MAKKTDPKDEKESKDDISPAKAELASKIDDMTKILSSGAKDISDDILKVLKKLSTESLNEYEQLIQNKNNSSFFGKKAPSAATALTDKDKTRITNIGNIINNDSSVVANDLEGLVDSLVNVNKKYFSVLRDYETMPIILPQISRVLKLLRDEIISPDIRGDKNFVVDVSMTDNQKEVVEGIDATIAENKMDTMFNEIVLNRLKIGSVFYKVTSYEETFNKALEILNNRALNESIDFNYFGKLADKNTSVISINESAFDPDFKLEVANITIKKGSSVEAFNMIEDEMVNESLSSINTNIFDEILNESYAGRVSIGTLNEELGSSVTSISPTVKDSYTSIINKIKKNEIKRCVIEKLDPTKVFKVMASGRLIGYIYVNKKEENNNSAKAIIDKLMKKTSNNNKGDEIKKLENTIITKTGEEILKAIHPNLTRIEDIDLFHDFVMNNKLFTGKSAITFYYKDDIFDLSRHEGSILTEAVFFTKLYVMLMVNNITTKILRGRNRQIHTVNMGVSNSTMMYLENAMEALINPEVRIGSLNGSFEQLINPNYGSGDIILPVEDGQEQLIRTDIIEGQNVDMDTDFLKFILNTIIISFGIDPGIVDATTNNIDFAKGFSQINIQMANLVKNEQNDMGEIKRMFLKIFELSDDVVASEINNGGVKINFFKPRSIALATTSDEINNAKNFADILADIHPELPEDDELFVKLFKFVVIKDKVSIDWAYYDTVIKEIEEIYPKLVVELDKRKKINDSKTNVDNTTKLTDDITTDDKSDEEALDDM